MVRGVDGRSADSRRYKDIVISLSEDIGGAAGLTEAQRALVAQAATMMVQSERLQGAMLRGEPVDIEQQTRVANSLARTLSRLGVRRREARPKTLAEHLARRGAA